MLSLDASRLARNNRDWHQLLELCSVFEVLIADGERLYEPTLYHDRLLLGLSGIMSEAELHQLRIRLHQGERQKAARSSGRYEVRGLGKAFPVASNGTPEGRQQSRRVEIVFSDESGRFAPGRYGTFEVSIKQPSVVREAADNASSAPARNAAVGNARRGLAGQDGEEGLSDAPLLTDHDHDDARGTQY